MKETFPEGIKIQAPPAPELHRASHTRRPAAAAGHPTQRWVLAEGAAGFECLRVAAMELESLHAELGLVLGPVHAALPMAQGFLATEACVQGQKSEASYSAAAAVRTLPFQSVGIFQLLAEHLHAAANPEDGTA